MFIKTVNPVPPFNNEVHERACHLEARDEQVFLTARDTHGQTDRQTGERHEVPSELPFRFYVKFHSSQNVHNLTTRLARSWPTGLLCSAHRG